MAKFPGYRESGAVMYISTYVALWGLAALGVAAKVWARYLIKTFPLRINDYAIFAAMFFATAFLGVSMVAFLSGGLGRHIQDATPVELVAFFKTLLVKQILWGWANFFIKISILHLYIDLFWISPIRLPVYICMGLATCLCMIVTFEALFLCRPLAYTWNRTVEGGSCANIKPMALSQAIINTCIDIAVLVLPMPVIWHMKMPLATKFGVVLMFSFGFGIVAITAVKLYGACKINVKDITYTSAQYQFLNFLETTLGIFNACLPLTAPVFKKIFGIGDKRNSNTVQDGIYKKLSHIAKVSGGWARRSTVWGTGRSTSLDADSETGNGGAPFGKENVSGPRGHTLGEALRRASMFEGENGAGLPSGRFETGNEKCIKIPLALVEVDEVPASPITRDQ